MSSPFLTGIIEGFYGRAWPHDVRLAYAGFLSQAGFNTCLYAPKSDPVLRRNWAGRWDAVQWRQLADLSATYADNGLLWGVGLSPMELYKNYGLVEKQQLRDKVDYLSQLGIRVLAILFDDMPGDIADLAQRQAQIMADVCHWAPDLRLLMCPTYYSYDPVLEKYFGQMPAGYRSALGACLDQKVDIFWTGNRVCSESISAQDIQLANDEFGRPVCLWDNYPVNDGAIRADFLYLDPLPDRAIELPGLLTGHLCNPMNEAFLSLPALSGLARLYGTGELGDLEMDTWLGEAAWAYLKEDAPVFATAGLAGMSDAQRAHYMARYLALPGPAAAEVVGWLRGEYSFDPACLTD